MAEVIGLARKLLADGCQREAADIARWLAAFTPVDLGEIHNAWIESGLLYPGIIFRGASDETARRILKFIPSEQLRLNHALLALAWIGTQFVCDLFAEWRASSPSWASELFIPPHAYAHEAGWELDSEGSKRTLYARRAYALVSVEVDSTNSPVTSILPTAGSCPWCAGPLIILLRFDTKEPRLLDLGLPETVVTCASCTCYGTVFMKVGRDSEVRWHSGNVKPPFVADEPGTEWTPAKRLVLGPARGELHGADQFLPTTLSQLGGAPAWVQDAVFPTCPDCGQTMPAIAQIVNGDIDPSMEGTYYIFWCRACGVTATEYQQT